MTLVNDCMNGMELRDASLSDFFAPVDFAITSDVTSLVLLAGWWTLDDFVHDGGAVFYSSPIQPGPSTDPSSPWAVGRATLGPSDELTAQLHANRDAADFDRPNYLSNLLMLKDAYPQFNFNDWIAAFTARPLRDPLKEFAQWLNAPRKMAKLLLVDGTGRAVDVLVVDDRGSAATGGDRLAQATSDFMSQTPTPDLSEYVNWLSRQTPYGPYAYRAPSSFTAGGSVDDQATNLLASALVA